MKRTISFKKGSGSINHNNLVFLAENVDPERVKDNIYFVQQDLDSAYDELFGTAIKAYDTQQTRKDRKYGSVKEYMIHLKHSKNQEKLYYEIIVQIGDSYDSGVGTAGGKVCAKVLIQYAQLFQERNSHLYVFNMVLHMDEASPHLHIDFIPVATGYCQGLRTRNSLTKALENQCFSNEKRNKYQNSLLSWQKKEREYLKEICMEYGLETVVLGIKRDDMDLATFKAHVKLSEAEVELKNVQEKARELEEQSNYYEERFLDITDINYGIFSAKKAEEDNKALQYQNRKLKEENDKLIAENIELKKVAELWNLLQRGLQTYITEKKDMLLKLIAKIISRGRDPLQVYINDLKEIDTKSPNRSIDIKNKTTNDELYGKGEH